MRDSGSLLDFAIDIENTCSSIKIDKYNKMVQETSKKINKMYTNNNLSFILIKLFL